uniref:Uncharacterized protein n=1 Tax=viral metagenome TaxID=1070528 RepID=A0A6C0HYA5_9ZZZZ
MIFIFFCLVYLTATIEEWVIHKYLMHQLFHPQLKNLYKNHILHHKKTKKDFSIENNETEYICFEFLSVDGLVQLFVGFFINTSLFYILFRGYVSLFVISATIMTFLLVNIFVWNTCHSYIHNMDAFEICSAIGLPRKYIDEQNVYVKWSLNNHRAHHYYHDSNYNIVFPGADFLFGTHKTITGL